VFVVGWTLMTVAMMLPSSLPLVNLVRAVTRSRPDRGRLLALLLTGYLGVWAYFGLLASLGDGLLHAVVAAVPEAASRADRISALVLLAVGLDQFTPLKRLCLDRCRSPHMFLRRSWGGPAPRRSALRLGVRHGLFCLGCCWTLMLLMFAVGGANLGWMLGLGAVMAAERTTRFGRRLTPVLGAVLVLGGGLGLLGILPPFV
jgi:predicted metal-binding membrane protein